MPDNRPLIGITMGDPCGIGAEIIVQALKDPDLRRRARFVVFGLWEQLVYTADLLECDLPLHRDHRENVRRYVRELTVVDYDEISIPAGLTRGPSRVGGKASIAFVEDAIQAAKDNLIDAIVTAPISKTSWQLAKFRKFPGHTELLAERTKTQRYAMMFVAPRLKVVLATIHVPITDIQNRLNIGAVFTPIDLLDKAMREWFGVSSPRIAVAGLNPHAGEGGHIGDEEERIIHPAIVMANEAGIDAHGPLPGDTIFLQALQGRYDAVVAMYHDQGLIPVKLLAWQQAVNLTLGLPIIRTSPDHGTAFDIAGTGRADAGSMKAAIALAIDLAARRIGNRQHVGHRL